MPTVPHPPQKEALPSGAIAGVAIGATLTGLAILGALGHFLWQRNRENKIAKKEEEAGLMGGSNRERLSGACVDGHKGELAAQTKQAELCHRKQSCLVHTLLLDMEAIYGHNLVAGSLTTHNLPETSSVCTQLHKVAVTIYPSLL